MKKELTINKAKQLYSKPQARSLLLNVLALVVVLLIGAPHYEYDMDVMMQAQLFNISGRWSTGMIAFSNIYVGRFLKLLCEFMTGVNWYTIFQYVLTFMSLWEIGRLFLKRNSSRIGNITFMIFDLFIGYECYICPSYMKTAAILGVSALYVCWGILVGELTQKRWLQQIYIGIALLLAGLISWKALLLSGSLTTVYIILYMFVRKVKVDKKLGKELWMPLVSALVLLVVLQVLDYREYQKVDGWSRVNEYRSAVEQVGMFRAPTYRADLGEKLGLQEYQYNVLVDGHYITSDGSAFEKLEKVTHAGRDFSWINILQFMRTVPVSLIQVSMFYGMFVLWLLLFFSHMDKKKVLLAATVIVTGLGYLIMFILASCSTSMVYFLILLPVGICALMNGKDMQATKEERHSALIYLALGTIVLYSGMGSSIVTKTNEGNINEELAEKVASLEQPWHVIGLNEYLKSYSAFERYDEGLIVGKNLVVLDGAYSLIPLYEGLIYPAGWNIDQPIDNVNIGANFAIWMHVM
ncbi:MAG: hypothetical protein ACLVFG_05005 [Lachnospiraceae bacterium]